MQQEEVEREERLAELTESYLAMLRAGEEVPTPDDYAAQYPEYAAELSELLEGLVQMEDLGKSSRPAMRPPIDFPDTLGDFHLEEKIGSGGMGTVFRAMQKSLRREVAVKILSPSWSADSHHREAFENESKLIARLRHTNIVEVFGAGEEGHWRYYVMSLVRGQGVRAGNLSKVFPGIPYEQAVARVGLQAAQALAYAHAHGVLHRDVKPGNLLLDNEGVLHVSDFGLATVLNAGEEAPLVTQTHDGTLRYMPPERLLRGENSFAGDQYSLGLTLYELITRRPVFRQTEPGELVRRICNDPLPPLKQAGELGAIINKSISFHPSERYPSMAAMADDLQRFLSGEPVHARPASRLRRYIMWVKRRPAVAVWSHAAALLMLMLFASMIVGYIRVRSAWHEESEQRLLAERNEQIADASLQRIFTGMTSKGNSEEGFLPPSRADARLIQDLMPYYEQIVAGAASGSDRMAQASLILASIALQTGDYSTAETYYRRAAEQFPTNSLQRAKAVNGLAAAIYSQETPEGSHPRRQEANDLLLHLVQEIRSTADTATRLELVRSLLFASRHSASCSCGESTQCSHERPGRGVLLARAAEILLGVLARQPDNKEAQLQRVGILATASSPELRRKLSPEGKQPVQIIDELLQAEPDSEELQRMYLRLAAHPAPPNRQATDLNRAARYALDLLAANPGDSESIFLFFAVRDRYMRALRRAGKTKEAEKEGERTLGVLTFLTARADFSQKTRERLIMLVAMHPATDEDRTRREEELRTLLKDYDGRRIDNLRRRMERMRREMNRRRDPRTPPPPDNKPSETLTGER